MFWLICRDTLRGTARWVALSVFCVSYFSVVEGTRTKGYSIDLLVATVVLWLMLQWELSGHKARYLAWLAVCAPVFIWVSYTAVFVIGAAGVILAGSLVKRAWEAAMGSSAYIGAMNRGGGESGGNPAVQTLARGSTALRQRDGQSRGGSWLADGDWLGWQNGLAVLALAASVGVSAWLLYQLNIRPALQESHTNGLREVWKGGFPPLAQPWKIPWWLLSVQTGRGFAWPIGDDHFGSTATFILWLTGLVVYWRRGNRRVWVLFVVTQVMALAAAFAGKYPYLQNPRVCFFLGPGICLFVGAGAQYLIFRFGGNNRRALYCGTALALAIYGLGGLGCDIVLRIREVKGPGIRSTLAEASRLVGPNGQFVVLNDQRGGWVFAYYIKRVVRQPVWWHGQTPPQTGPVSKLALVVRGPTEDNPQANPLFRQFEQRFPRRLVVTWSQVSHQVLIGSKDTTTVWVCE
jgi:hypothetical protein